MNVCAVVLALAMSAHPGDDPFADVWTDYDPGANPGAFTDPGTALGPPERFTGEGVFPVVVSAFSPPFGTDEIVSVGAGGLLVVQFATPVTDDPRNPFGIDLLVFGNTGFIDAGGATVGGVFGADGGVLEVSDGGETWTLVPGVAPDGLMPTIGYLDSGPYDDVPGALQTSFVRPVDPAVALEDLLGLDYAQLLAVYAGSGGGAGIDIGALGLSAVTHVRVTNPGDPASTPAVEIDAFADVRAAADLDGDGAVGAGDLLALLAAWGPCPAPPAWCPADLDADGSVGTSDLIALLEDWGP